jgi:hypothetical protein
MYLNFRAKRLRIGRVQDQDKNKVMQIVCWTPTIGYGCRYHVLQGLLVIVSRLVELLFQYGYVVTY